MKAYICADLHCEFHADGGRELWVHGHTHDSTDYQLGRTMVLCNPLGYAGVEVNPFFKTDEAVIEL